MAKKFNSLISVEDRTYQFHSTYGNDFDAGWTLVALFTECGKYLARIVGEQRANEGMAVMASDLSCNKPESWISDLGDAGTNAFSEWPLGQQLHDLTAYAVFGIILEDIKGKRERELHLKIKIDAAVAFLQASPIKLWNIDDGKQTELEILIMLAMNRWAMDHDEPVEPAALAWFGQLAEGSIRNMMSGAKSTFSNSGGKIPAQEALKWLSNRESFFNSVWRGSEIPDYKQERGEELSAPVFVPVSQDGSIFHPGLQRSQGFEIGKKGDEKYVNDYSAALAELQAMPTPYWRRPNKNGIFGIVKGIRWERLDSEFLISVAANKQFRMPLDVKMKGVA